MMLMVGVSDPEAFGPFSFGFRFVTLFDLSGFTSLKFIGFSDLLSLQMVL